MASRALTGTLDLTRVGSIDLPEIKIMVRSGYSRGYSCDRNVTEEAEAKVNQCYRQAIVEVLFSDPAFKAYFDGDDVPTSLLRPKTNVNVNFSNGLITIRRGEEITTRQIHEFDLPEESIEKFASLSKVAIEAFNGATGRSLNSYTQGRILPDRHIGGALSPLITAPRHPESFDRSELPLTNINQISENLARDLAQCRSPKEAKMLLSQTRYATVMMHEYQAIFSSLQDRYSIALARIDHQIEKESDPAKLRMLQVSRKPMQEKLDRVKNMKTHIDHLDCYAIYNVLKANAHLHESASREGFILGPSDSKRVEAVHQLYQTTLEDHKATNVSGWFWKTTIDNNSEKREQYAKKVSHMLFTTLHDKYPHVGRNEQQTFEEAIVLSASKLMTSLGRRDAGFLGLPQGLFSELGPEVEHYLKEAHEKATAYAFEHAKEALTESTELEDGEEAVSFAMKGGSLQVVTSSGTSMDNGFARIVQSSKWGLKDLTSGKALLNQRFTDWHSSFATQKWYREQFESRIGETFDARLVADHTEELEHLAELTDERERLIEVRDPSRPDNAFRLPPLLLPAMREEASELGDDTDSRAGSREEVRSRAVSLPNSDGSLLSRRSRATGIPPAPLSEEASDRGDDAMSIAASSHRDQVPADVDGTVSDEGEELPFIADFKADETSVDDEIVASGTNFEARMGIDRESGAPRFREALPAHSGAGAESVDMNLEATRERAESLSASDHEGISFDDRALENSSTGERPLNAAERARAEGDRRIDLDQYLRS